MFKYSIAGLSVSTKLDNRRANSEGKYQARIQVVFNRLQRYYGTGLFLTLDEWERMPTTKNKQLFETRKKIENRFNVIQENAEDLYLKEDLTFDNLDKRLLRGSNVYINNAFRSKIDELKAENMIGNSMIYDTVLKGIERFSPRKISFQSINIDWVKRYEKFLLGEGKSYNTISIHLRTIRAILNEAKKEGIIKESSYPFNKDGFQIKSGEGRKMALTIDQIGMIYGYDDGHKATSKFRDYWMFLYFCNGINMADFVRLKFSNIINGEIYFTRQKTERTTRTRQEICAVVTPEMQEIIAKWGNPQEADNYIFPILDGSEDAMRLKRKTQYATRAINKHMAIIGKALGLGNISTYTARHSFATVLKRSGANIAYISESLGHNNLQTTESYLASFESEERKKNAAMLSQFHKKDKSTSA